MAHKGKVTSAAVARAAGVSRTTVSFVLNNKPGANISQETRDRVLEAARQLNYVPDASARNLATGRTKTIAFAVHKPSAHAFADIFLSSLLSGLVRRTKRAGFRITLQLTEEDHEISTLANLVRSGEVDGLVATGWSDETQFIAAGLSPQDPVVLLSEWPFSHFNNIAVDLLRAQRQIVGAALERGHRRFGCIPYIGLDESESQRRRFDDFQAQLTDAGAELLPDCVVAGDLTVEGGKAAMKAVLNASEWPSVIFGMNDTMAVGALQACEEEGLSVPQDMSLIGFEGQAITAFLTPAISTVKIPWVEMGEGAADLILDRLLAGNLSTESQHLISSELLLRQSLMDHSE